MNCQYINTWWFKNRAKLSYIVIIVMHLLTMTAESKIAQHQVLQSLTMWCDLQNTPMLNEGLHFQVQMNSQSDQVQSSPFHQHPEMPPLSPFTTFDPPYVPCQSHDHISSSDLHWMHGQVYSGRNNVEHIIPQAQAQALECNDMVTRSARKPVKGDKRKGSS